MSSVGDDLKQGSWQLFSSFNEFSLAMQINLSVSPEHDLPRLSVSDLLIVFLPNFVSVLENFLGIFGKLLWGYYLTLELLDLTPIFLNRFSILHPLQLARVDVAGIFSSKS